MDFALERQFMDPYHSGANDINSLEGSGAEAESIGVERLQSYS